MFRNFFVVIPEPFETKAAGQPHSKTLRKYRRTKQRAEATIELCGPELALFGHSIFGFASNFGFRYSDFGLPHSDFAVTVCSGIILRLSSTRQSA